MISITAFFVNIIPKRLIPFWNSSKSIVPELSLSIAKNTSFKLFNWMPNKERLDLIASFNKVFNSSCEFTGRDDDDEKDEFDEDDRFFNNGVDFFFFFFFSNFWIGEEEEVSLPIILLAWLTFNSTVAVLSTNGGREDGNGRVCKRFSRFSILLFFRFGVNFNVCWIGVFFLGVVFFFFFFFRRDAELGGVINFDDTRVGVCGVDVFVIFLLSLLLLPGDVVAIFLVSFDKFKLSIFAFVFCIFTSSSLIILSTCDNICFVTLALFSNSIFRFAWFTCLSSLFFAIIVVFSFTVIFFGVGEDNISTLSIGIAFTGLIMWLLLLLRIFFGEVDFIGDVDCIFNFDDGVLFLTTWFFFVLLDPIRDVFNSLFSIFFFTLLLLRLLLSSLSFCFLGVVDDGSISASCSSCIIKSSILSNVGVPGLLLLLLFILPKLKLMDFGVAVLFKSLTSSSCSNKSINISILSVFKLLIDMKSM